MLQIAVCCRVLQCGVVCCRVLQCVQRQQHHAVMQCGAVYCMRVLQYVVVYYSVLHCVVVYYSVLRCVVVYDSMCGISSATV